MFYIILFRNLTFGYWIFVLEVKGSTQAPESPNLPATPIPQDQSIGIFLSKTNRLVYDPHPPPSTYTRPTAQTDQDRNPISGDNALI